LSKEDPEICDFIPEVKNAKLGQVNCVNKEYFVAIYKRDVIPIRCEFIFCLLICRLQAKDEIYLYSRTGIRLDRLAPDFVGTGSITNREKQPHFFLTMSGFNTPGIIARYDFTSPETQRSSILRTTKVNGLNLDDFESTQVWYESKDGTKVPMFIVRHKSTEFDGTAAAIQYGSSFPSFITMTVRRISNNRLCPTQVMVDLLLQWIHSLVQSSPPFCKLTAQSWLFRTSGVEANSVKNGTGAGDEKIRSTNYEL
jgi:hypothetical protein